MLFFMWYSLTSLEMQMKRFSSVHILYSRQTDLGAAAAATIQT